MSMNSEDVSVRCKQCGAEIGTATVRSASDRVLKKLAWILGRLLCPKCEDVSR